MINTHDPASAFFLAGVVLAVTAFPVLYFRYYPARPRVTIAVSIVVYTLLIIGSALDRNWSR